MVRKAGLPPLVFQGSSKSANGHLNERPFALLFIGDLRRSHRSNPDPPHRLHYFLFIRERDCHLFQRAFIQGASNFETLRLLILF